MPDVTIREPVQTRLSLDPWDDRSRTESLVESNRTESIDPASAPGAHHEPRGREDRVRPTLRTAVSPQERLNPGVALPAAARLRPASLPDASERAERPTDMSPPTIQVTIGRVEVRAPAASAREARRVKATPSVLPLNDYLRRRKEGA